MKSKIKISLSTTGKELWQTAVELEAGFDKIVDRGRGVFVALDVDGAVISTFVPENTPMKQVITVDNMRPKDVIIGTPDGEIAIIEQNPTNTDIFVNQTGQGPNPIVPSPNFSVPTFPRIVRPGKLDVRR